MSKMPAKKKSCFQITSVIQAQVGAGGTADDTESLDDPDESRAEDGTAETFEGSRGDFELDGCEDALNNIGDVETPALQRQPGTPGGPGPQPVSCSSRFRVIKLDHSTGEPYRRGRWTCTEFYDKEPEAALLASRTQPAEHLPDRDSGLGASVVAPQTSGDPEPVAVHPYEPAIENNTAGQPVVPPHSLLVPGQNGAVHLQKSPIAPQMYPNPNLPSHHVPSQTTLMPGVNLEYGQQHLPLTRKVGDLGMGQAVSPQNLMDWMGVMSGVQLTPSAIQMGQYSGLVMPGGVPEDSRRMSDMASAAAALIQTKEPGKPGVPEELPLVANSGVNSLFGITIPIDGDEDSASGASVVAIDNKIEQAMDLVKSHLMYAVREEVEVLKEQIKELCERNSMLERENAVLKSLANTEQLSQLPTHTAAVITSATTTTTATTLSASNPTQPSVSSA